MSGERDPSVGVVAIGRNEGERLKACLRSALAVSARVVYVDSGSDDGSVEFAQAHGVRVVVLGTDVPFTAARARNAGMRALVEEWSGVEFVQFVDGDCELDPGWVPFALRFLRREPRAAVACGRRRERHPEASVYNELCDLEWDTPVGEARSCGGDALIRVAAFTECGGYRDGMIAGEEPEMCVRIRAAGWSVHRLEHEMTLHDAAITRLGQWWRRALRSGHAYAEGASLHGAPPERHGVRSVRSAMAWGLALPVVTLALAWHTRGLSVLVFAVLLVSNVLRNRAAERRRGRTPRQATLLAISYLAMKLPQAQGVLLFAWRRLTRRQATLIEYKGG